MAQESLIKLSKVSEKTSLGKTSIYTDVTFPKPVKVGLRAVAWVESEVDAWIAKRIAQSRMEKAQ